LPITDNRDHLLSSPFSFDAIAMPKAALIDVLEWPTPKASISLSARLGNADTPPPGANSGHPLFGARQESCGG